MNGAATLLSMRAAARSCQRPSFETLGAQSGAPSSSEVTGAPSSAVWVPDRRQDEVCGFKLIPRESSHVVTTAIEVYFR